MITKRWHRIEKLIGKDKLALLKTKKVLVVGLGGVGGYVVEGLVRSGVEQLTIIDCDQVEESNLNRQIIALESTIGENKAELMKKRAMAINSNSNIHSEVTFVDSSNITEILKEPYDYVVDACDTVSTKKLLIEKCLLANIPIISCMGTARKMDPRKLEIVDIQKTSYDPLAKIIRKYMKEQFPNQKLSVLSSREVPQKEEDAVLGSMIFVPAIAGLMIANFIVREWIK